MNREKLKALIFYTVCVCGCVAVCVCFRVSVCNVNVTDFVWMHGCVSAEVSVGVGV